MYYSKKLSLLFIGSPKSETRSVEKHLMKIDADGQTVSLAMGHKKSLLKICILVLWAMLGLGN
jgi:hypothetical protein